MKTLESVLLIDDDYATNYLHQIFLEESKRVNNIIIAKGANEALDLLKEKIKEDSIPEIIFLDINMPAKNGWEFLDDYKKMVQTPNEKSVVIMLSTSEYPGDIKKSKDNSMIDEYQIKPLSEEIIHQLIDKYFPS